MHRQSLGSPSSKLHGDAVKDESLAYESHKLITNPEEEKETQKLKSIISKSPEKYIHLIPILTLFCFLILYLSSHSPSQDDLAQFSEFKHFPKPTDSDDGIEEFETIRNGDILMIRSLKNLEEKTAIENRNNRLHRKIVEF